MVEPTKYTLFCKAATRRAFLASPATVRRRLHANAVGKRRVSRGAGDGRRYQSWAAWEAIQSETKSA